MNIEHRLSVVLSEFARTLLTDFSIESILDHLVMRIVEVLPVTGAGVTLILPGASPRYVAASDDLALGFEGLQGELNEGPCVLASASGEAVSVPDLRHDDRFPRYSARAIDQGIAAVFAFPLKAGDHQIGALDLYQTTAGPLSDDAMAAAQTLADVAAAYILNAPGCRGPGHGLAVDETRAPAAAVLAGLAMLIFVACSDPQPARSPT